MAKSNRFGDRESQDEASRAAMALPGRLRAFVTIMMKATEKKFFKTIMSAPF
jgi:hypothetical protein